MEPAKRAVREQPEARRQREKAIRLPKLFQKHEGDHGKQRTQVEAMRLGIRMKVADPQPRLRRKADEQRVKHLHSYMYP